MAAISTAPASPKSASKAPADSSPLSSMDDVLVYDSDRERESVPVLSRKKKEEEKKSKEYGAW